MHIVNIVGARPNFVKMAPLIHAMLRRPGLTPTLVHTGQHYDQAMSEQFFQDLEIRPPDFNLGVGSGTHALQTGQVMQRLDPILESLKPDMVLVVGDVNSTLAAAITAVKRGILVAHVEAGLRSFDRSMPEEINRILTDAVSDFLFVTEDSGRVNLLKEGVDPAKIHFVGNVMIDALQNSRRRWERSPIFDTLGLGPSSSYAVLTLHRPSNVDDTGRLASFVDALETLARHIPIIFPVHPRVKQQLTRRGHLGVAQADSYGRCHEKGITYIDPLGYLDFVALVSRARLVLTDSGGIQEEATILGIPCLTLRDTTERPVTVTHGTNRIIGSDPNRILDESLKTLGQPLGPNTAPPLWDGRAAERIVDILDEYRLQSQGMTPA
ncbi:MAG TPA: UDP-N-acetylglucosamine 2-epimerase (non-hydrolyzing) [Methylomirabilota bacterium]|nr:UDP-N-acetylglucosamine 2-epimerase (non-hydrolyzing) [Methylomirabilota bacterium]